MSCSYGLIGHSGHLNQSRLGPAARGQVWRSFPRFLQGRELVAKLFSERTQLRMENEQTAQLLTGSINASLNVADGEIQPGGDFADFSGAAVLADSDDPAFG